MARSHDPGFELSALRCVKDYFVSLAIQDDGKIFAVGIDEVSDLIDHYRFILSAIGLFTGTNQNVNIIIINP